MDRKQVLIPEEQTLRQRDFERKIRELHAQRGKSVRALVDTFGCQQNVADSQHIMGMLEAMGCTFVTAPEDADIVVLNTCAIRDHAEKRVYGTLGALTHTKKANPEQLICLCGCMAQRPEVAEKVRQSYRHVDLVFGPQALWKFPELLYQVYTRRGRVFSVEEEHGAIAEGMPVVREGRTRAWVSIMYGCNNFCSYCIVPYVRGRERSREPARIIEEVRQLAAEGYKEITLLGQNVNSYGKDLDTPYDFSFSGLKTAVINIVHRMEQKGETLPVADLAASFQKGVTDCLVEKLEKAATDYGYTSIALAGGVSANSRLRRETDRLCRQKGWQLHLPALKYCGDNGAMVGAQGYYEYVSGVRAQPDLNAYATMPIDRPTF